MGLSVDDIYSAIQLMLAPVYVNDFFYQGARASACTMQADAPYRMDAESLSHFYTPRTPRPTRVVRRRHACRRHDPAVASWCKSKWDVAAAVADALQRLRRGGDRRFAGARPQLGRGDGRRCRRSSTHDLPAGFGYDWAGQSLPGNPLRQPDHDADGAVDRRGVPVPGRAVRKLVGAGGGAAGRAGGRPRRGRAVDGARPAERHLLQDRPDHDHRPGGEERDPDRRVRDPGAQRGQAARRGGGRSGASCDCGRS